MKRLCRYCNAECERGDVCRDCRDDDRFDYSGITRDEARRDAAMERDER